MTPRKNAILPKVKPHCKSVCTNMNKHAQLVSKRSHKTINATCGSIGFAKRDKSAPPSASFVQLKPCAQSEPSSSA
jgi:hypothetical protein